MTLRRLNIQIQGFPESYATDPHMSDDMVVGEPNMPTPSLGIASIASGLVAQPAGVVGSDVASGEPEAAVSNGTSHATPMETESAPVDSNVDVESTASKETETAPKETKTASTSP